MIIDVTNNSVSGFRQAVTNAGLKLKESVTDEEIQNVLNKQSGEVNFSLDKHDNKTITGYSFIESDE